MDSAFCLRDNRTKIAPLVSDLEQSHVSIATIGPLHLLVHALDIAPIFNHYE